MPYKLRKAPGRNLYWVVSVDTGKKHSKDPIPLDSAKAQMRVLINAMGEEMPTQDEVDASDRFRDSQDVETIKHAVLGVNCRRIDKELVRGMEDKRELVAYLRSRNCPALIRLEAMLEKKFD